MKRKHKCEYYLTYVFKMFKNESSVVVCSTVHVPTIKTFYTVILVTGNLIYKGQVIHYCDCYKYW